MDFVQLLGGFKVRRGRFDPPFAPLSDHLVHIERIDASAFCCLSHPLSLVDPLDDVGEHRAGVAFGRVQFLE